MTSVAITHPDKVLFPDDGITKQELAAYYDAVAPVMLPHLRRRPVTMERFPNGIGAEGFLQKDVVKGFPAWLTRVEAPKKGGTVHYTLANDRRSLQWLANQNTITLHVWTSRAPKLDRPDLCILDLDPSQDEPEVLRRATLGRARCARRAGTCQLGEDVGVEGISHRRAARRTAHVRPSRPRSPTASPTILVERHPSDLTREFSKADRAGRIFVDTGRNRAGSTFAAAYTVRARSGAPVSAPCTWEEIERGLVGPQTFTLRTMAARLARVGDLWQNLGRAR